MRGGAVYARREREQLTPLLQRRDKMMAQTITVSSVVRKQLLKVVELLFFVNRQLPADRLNPVVVNVSPETVPRPDQMVSVSATKGADAGS